MPGFKIADAFVDVTADASKVGPGVQSSVKKSGGLFSGIGKSVGLKIVGGLAAAGIGKAITGYLSNGVTYASDLNEAVSRTDVVFGDSASKIHDWSKTTSKGIGLSEGAAESAAGAFGNIFTQMGFGNGVAADMSTSWIQMAADIGSFNNLDTAEGIDMQSSALRGEYDSLQRVFPAIDAARVQQQALTETGKDSVDQLTEQEKAQALQTLMLKDGEKSTGDFARTQEGFANQSKIAAANTAELGGKFGAILLPMLTKLQGILIDYVIPAVTAIIDNFKTWGPILGIVAAAVGVYAIALGVLNAGMIASKIAMVASTVAQWALNTAMSMNPIGLIVVAIAALVAGLIYFFTQTELGQKVWENIMDAMSTSITWLNEKVIQPILTAIGVAWDFLYEYVIKPVVNNIMSIINLWIAVIKFLWNGVVSPILGFIGSAFSWLYENVIKPVVGGIKTYLTTLGDAFSWLWDNGISPVIDFISDAMTRVGDKIGDVFGDIAGVIKGAFDGTVSFLKSVINSIIRVINGATSGVNTLIRGVNKVPGVNFPTIPAIPHLAKGGTATSGGAALVGEEGPEILNLKRGASIIPLSRAGGGGQKTSIHIANVTIDASNVDEIRKVIDVFETLGQTARAGGVTA